MKSYAETSYYQILLAAKHPLEESLVMSDQKWLTTSAGLKMPCIIYGTAWKKERTADLVSKALQAGFRGIDTACQPKHYDERLVGVALQRMKDQGRAIALPVSCRLSILTTFGFSLRPPWMAEVRKTQEQCSATPG